MKTPKIILPVGLALTLIVGCDKQPASNNTGPGSSTTTTSNLVDPAKAAAEQAAKEVKTAADTAVADAAAKANALIEQAKTLLRQSKYTEALNSLQQLSTLKLTPEQEKLVASLKEQIQKAMAAKATTDAAGAASSLIPKK